MDEQELLELVNRGHELLGVEFKSGGAFGNGLRAKAIRAILALSNLRDGGTLIVGVAEQGVAATLVPLNAEQAATWSADAVLAQVNRYADPPIDLRCEHVLVGGGTAVVISVEPFATEPTICSRDCHVGDQQVLVEGAVYVRSLARRASEAVKSAQDMRALLDMAIERRLARFVATAERAGVDLQLAVDSAAEAEAAYDRELEGL